MGVETDEESRALFLTGPQPQVTVLGHCPPPFPERYFEAKTMHKVVVVVCLFPDSFSLKKTKVI